MAERDDMVTPRLWTVVDVSQQLRVTPRTVRRWIASGQLKAIHLGRSVRIPDQEVAAVTARGLPRDE